MRRGGSERDTHTAKEEEEDAAEVFLPLTHAPFAHENLELFCAPLVTVPVRCLRRAWFDSGYMCMRLFSRLSGRIPTCSRNSLWIPWYVAPACSVSVSPVVQRGSGLASTCIRPFVLLLIRCLHGTVLVDMVDLDRVAAGMDVDVAAGVENQRYTPRTNVSDRSAALETGGVMRTADTVRVSPKLLRMPRRPQSRRKSQSWRRRLLEWATTSLFQLATSSGERARTAPE